MNIQTLKWQDQHGEDHDVVQVDFDADDIAKATLVASQKVNHINAHNPGGIRRSHGVIRSRIIAGKLADAAVAEMISCCIQGWSLPSQISLHEYDDERTDNFVNPDPYDLMLRRDDGAERIIEVRSSFCYRLAPVKKMIDKLSVYGWYTSENKPVEPPRDSYFQVVYYLRPADVPAPDKGPNIGVFEQQLAKGSVTAYVVGGASRGMLDQRGINREDQDGANYRAIYPVSSALDSTEMMKTLLRQPWD